MCECDCERRRVKSPCGIPRGVCGSVSVTCGGGGGMVCPAGLGDLCRSAPDKTEGAGDDCIMSCCV